MNLPTLLVIFFLLDGNLHQEVTLAPNMDVCVAVQKDAKKILVNTLKRVPDAFAATCVTMKPITKDA